LRGLLKSLFARSKTNDLTVQMNACWALIRSGKPEDVSTAFRITLSLPPPMRAKLADALKPHVLMLSDLAIPEALAASDPRRVIAALELIEQCQLRLPLKNLHLLLKSEHPEIRAAAIRVMALRNMSSQK